MPFLLAHATYPGRAWSGGHRARSLGGFVLHDPHPPKDQRHFAHPTRSATSTSASGVVAEDMVPSVDATAPREGCDVRTARNARDS